jgi:hypothetical protein
MARTTNEQVKNMFVQFVETIGGTIAARYDDVGGYRLDHNPTYGGFVIERIHNEHGGVTRPFGDMRRKNSEMWDTLRFAIDAIHAAQDSAS